MEYLRRSALPQWPTISHQTNGSPLETLQTYTRLTRVLIQVTKCVSLSVHEGPILLTLDLPCARMWGKAVIMGDLTTTITLCIL